MSNQSLIDLKHPLNVCRASAGTGKTFTLAAYYVGLLLSGESFRSILAVTFTNKATAEMRERIIQYLYGIAYKEENSFFQTAKKFMIRDMQLSDAELRSRAERCFREMLLDYDNVQVQTIDSFLQSLQSGIAGVLHLSTGMNTELDINHVISTAVEQLLTTHLTDNIRELMDKYLNVQLDKDNRWDVRNAICAMAKELYNESVQSLDSQGKVVFDAGQIEAYREKLKTNWENNPRRKELSALVLPFKNKEFTGANSGYLKTAIDYLTASLEDPEKVEKKYLFRGLTDTQYEKASAGKWTELPQDAVQAIVQATDLGKQLCSDYYTYTLTVEFSHEMQLMSALRERINDILAQQDSVFLAETANRLCRALHSGDADFILEKAGVRYKHVLMDEFQDTSKLQWSVFRRLLDDVLATYGNTLLVVGDIKQSIYRWRNGDWHIMAELGKPNGAYADYNNAKFKNLSRSFRSCENVVRFNLSLFRHVVLSSSEQSQELFKTIYDEGFQENNLDDYYQTEKKSGGYVRFRAFAKKSKEKGDESDASSYNPQEVMTYDMFDAMENLLQNGAHASDLMVLVRRNKEAMFITGMKSQLSESDYPFLSRTRFVSSDSYLLDASRDVLTVISALQYMTTKDVLAARMIAENTQRDVSLLQTISTSIPLYEMVSEIIRLLLCNEQGLYHGTETAYLDAFLDQTRTYVTRYGSCLKEFLEYWEDTLHSKAISTSADNAVRIMTVHSSKGLEAQTLFVPFCDWTREVGQIHPKVWCEGKPQDMAEKIGFVPIQEGSKMEKSEYSAEYQEEHINMAIDNLNMLYVALTRARDNLYVSSCFSLNKDNKLGKNDHVGTYLLENTGLTTQIQHPDELDSVWDMPYAEYAIGGKPVIAGEKEESTENEIELQLCSNSDRVCFVQSQDSLLYTDYGEEAERRAARIEIGNICHEVFARLTEKIVSHHDWQVQLNAILDDFETQGLIESPDQRKDVFFLVSKAWNDPLMQKWFRTPFVVEAEQALYMDGKEYRPDRVMVDKTAGKAIVVDYKFGARRDDKYSDQVRLYMRAMRLMNYDNVEGYLWYARTGELIEVKDE
ncbi:MAG: UvrD-helicase domain-containing protein [Paludibacteraceae bacterium]|nr:UvrD-helicase domain-containing protein [Paludibacteraceae bacterium]